MLRFLSSFFVCCFSLPALKKKKKKNPPNGSMALGEEGELSVHFIQEEAN